MGSHFTDTCNAEGITFPLLDPDVRVFLENTGAAFSRKPGAIRAAERLEAAAAVAWARNHLNDDAAWIAIPDPAAVTLRALYPVKASTVLLGGTIWVLPFRALVQAQITPHHSPAKDPAAAAAAAAAAGGPALRQRAPGLGGQVQKNLAGALNAAANPGAGALPLAAANPAPGVGPIVDLSGPIPHVSPPAPTGLPAALAAALAAFSAASAPAPGPAQTPGIPAALAAAIAAFTAPSPIQPPAPGQLTLDPPYLAAPALVAVLDPARLTQLYLGEAWSLDKRSTRDKHLTRMQTSSQFDRRFEDPADPMWAQRLAFRRGPGSAFTRDEVNRDGKNVALALRWESRELHQSRGDWAALRRMTERAQLVREAWAKIMEGIRSQQGVPGPVVLPILLAIQEILDTRAAEAGTELGLLGPAGKEICTDMARQKAEIPALFEAYQKSMGAQQSGKASLQDVARRTNGLWYALLQPSMLYICSESATAPENDSLVTQAETAGAAAQTGQTIPAPGPAGAPPQPATFTPCPLMPMTFILPSPHTPLTWPWAPGPATMVASVADQTMTPGTATPSSPAAPPFTPSK